MEESVKVLCITLLANIIFLVLAVYFSITSKHIIRTTILIILFAIIIGTTDLWCVHTVYQIIITKCNIVLLLSNMEKLC